MKNIFPFVRKNKDNFMSCCYCWNIFSFFTYMKWQNKKTLYTLSNTHYAVEEGAKAGGNNNG